MSESASRRDQAQECTFSSMVVEPLYWKLEGCSEHYKARFEVGQQHPCFSHLMYHADQESFYFTQ